MGWSRAGIGKRVGAVCRQEANGVPIELQRLSMVQAPSKRLKLGEDLLALRGPAENRIWRLMRSREWGPAVKPSAGGLDGLTDASDFVTAQIVEDHDVTAAGQVSSLLDVSQKAPAVDRFVQNARCGDPAVAQGSKEGRGLPQSVGRLGDRPRAAGPWAGAMVDHFALDHRRKRACPPSAPAGCLASRDLRRPRPGPALWRAVFVLGLASRTAGYGPAPSGSSGSCAAPPSADRTRP